jgi:hypothetical protein
MVDEAIENISYFCKVEINNTKNTNYLLIKSSKHFLNILNKISGYSRIILKTKPYFRTF